ncbi:MAG: zinc dependent phospholipase C family protein [Lachnospiraceae bacterium]|nr:zinc dependent phospholipase C family protein [Lachnospiraceae bacterium]
MPAAYAHHRFGEACIESLPPKLKAVCTRYREIFDVGVHGPDVLFYYNPLISNKVNRHGSELHAWTGAQFFQVSRYQYQYIRENKKAMLAYLLGVLAHFTLDSACHDYINEETEETEFSHNFIESQYEAFLMKKDGKDPLKVDRSLTLHPTAKNAEIIARFYPFEREQVLKAMEGQKFCLHLFYSPKERKKGFLRKLLKALRIKGDVGDLFVDSTGIPACEQMNEIIFARQKAAEGLYCKLAKNLVRYLYDREELDSYFQYDFEGDLHSDDEESCS